MAPRYLELLRMEHISLNENSLESTSNAKRFRLFLPYRVNVLILFVRRYV